MAQQFGRGRRLSGDKDFLSAIAVALASEAFLVRVNVDGAFLAGFEICENLSSNLLCRNRHGHHVEASLMTCLCRRDLWNGILDDRHHDVNEKRCLDVAVGSESVIDLLRWSRSNRHLNAMTPMEILCVANPRRCSFVYARELQRWI